MQLSFICPTSYLETLDQYQDLYLLLAHVALYDAGYRAFFRASRKMKMMDNGAHELGTSIDFKQVVDLALELGCSEVVLPDTLFDAKKTLLDSEAALDWMRQAGLLRYITPMAVVQGSTHDEFIKCHNVMSGFKEIGVLGLAFRTVEKCYQEVTQLSGTLVNRLECLRELDAGWLGLSEGDKMYHLLGLGNVAELVVAKHYPMVRSNDSTKQVRYALRGTRFTDCGDCPDRLSGGYLDFNAPMTLVALEATLKNIEITKKVVAIHGV